MNTIYRTVFNKSLGQWVVASELAGAKGSSVAAATGCSRVLRRSLLIVTMVLLLQGWSQGSRASTYSPATGCISKSGNVISANGFVTDPTDAGPVDGMDTYSNVTGCNATGNGQPAVSVYGTFSEATAEGATVFGFSSTADKWGSAFGPLASATGLGSTALGVGATATNEGDVALGSGSTTEKVVATTGDTINGKAYTYAGSAPDSTVSVGQPTYKRTVTNVAAGRVSATSTDAVNGSQLYATNQAVDDLGIQVNALSTSIADLQNNQSGHVSTSITNLQSGKDGYLQVNDTSAKGTPQATGNDATAGGAGAVASGNTSTAVGSGAQATASNSVALGSGSVADRADSVSVGRAGHERQVTHVAAGTAGTDAVNVNQLQASQAGTVQYDKNADGSTNYSSVTLNRGGSRVTVHNVAAGSATSDAVNVGQLNDSMNRVKDWSRSYTDQRFESVNQNLNRLGHRADAGVASAIAMASLPQAYQPNQNSAGVALGSFHGEAGIALGVSTISESGRYVLKLNATSNTRGDVGVGAGAGVVW